jgi:hypothetical protein
MRFAPRFASVLMLLFSLSFLCLARTTRADDPKPPTQGTLYLGQGQILEAAVPRQLTLGENIYQFDYQPRGLSIACVGERQGGDTGAFEVHLIGVRHGSSTTLMSDTFHIGEDGRPLEADIPTLIQLSGWSGNGRYLMLQQSKFVKPEHPAFPGDFRLVNTFTVVDVGVIPCRVIPLSLPDTNATDADTIFWWSPTRSRLLFAAQGVFRDGAKHYIADTFCSVYDPPQNRLTAVELKDGQITIGWLDDTHLLLKQTIDGKTHFFSDDMTAGVQAETPTPAHRPIGVNEADPMQDKSMISPKASFLTLQDEPRLLTDPLQVTSQRAHALWVRRTQGPKPQSALPVGLTPGQDTPQARWSPNGQQIAFISHGDLFVTDLTTRQATPAEILGANEPLNCEEERILASANLKQIGLAIVQYELDHESQFPSANGLAKCLSPYLADSSLFSLSGHPFVYHAPADLDLNRMDSPASAVIGTMDLPCATITLYADGHVKDILKSGN